MNRSFSKILILIILIILAGGGFFAWRYFWVPKEDKEAKLVTFEIVPSCKGEAGWILYQKGAKAIAKAENLNKVEFWVAPTGTGMEPILYTKSEMIKTDNQWEFLLPDMMFVTDLYALGFDSTGKEMGKISLGNIYGIEGYPENCKKDETADRQTYRNEKYGFEFKYPEDWAAIESTSPQYPYLVSVTLGRQETIQQGGLFGVILRDQSKDEFFSLLTQEKFYIISQSDTTLGDKQATFYTLGRTDSPGIEWKEVITPRDSSLLEFSKGATPGYEDIFNQMLSTFRFIEPTKLEVSQPENQLKEGGVYSIKWNQTGLESKKVNIYLYAYQQDGKDIEPKIDYQYYQNNDLTPKYLIAKDVLASQELFNWNIPIGLSQRFKLEPAKYKIQVGDVSVLSGWGVEVRNLPLSQTKTYITISK